MTRGWCAYTESLFADLKRADTLALLFADDPSQVVTAPNLEELRVKIEEAAGQLIEWCARNKTYLNFEKSGVIVFDASRKGKNDQMEFNFNHPALKNPINIPNKGKLGMVELGVHFDSTLSFQKQAIRFSLES